MVTLLASCSMRIPIPASPSLPRCSARSPSSVPPTTVTLDAPEMERTEYFRESLGIALRVAPSASFSVMSPLSERRYFLSRASRARRLRSLRPRQSPPESPRYRRVPLGALVLDVDDERRFGRSNARLRCSVLSACRKGNEASRRDEGTQEKPRGTFALENHDGSAPWTKVVFRRKRVGQKCSNIPAT